MKTITMDYDEYERLSNKSLERKYADLITYLMIETQVHEVADFTTYGGYRVVASTNKTVEELVKDIRDLMFRAGIGGIK